MNKHALLVLILIAALSHAQEVKDPQRFQVEEHFGVTHPMQIVDFDVAGKVDPAKAHVVNGKGEPVEFQFLQKGKKVAVMTRKRKRVIPYSQKTQKGHSLFGNERQAE